MDNLPEAPSKRYRFSWGLASFVCGSLGLVTIWLAALADHGGFYGWWFGPLIYSSFYILPILGISTGIAGLLGSKVDRETSVWGLLLSLIPLIVVLFLAYNSRSIG